MTPHIGSRISIERKLAGLTQSQLAQKTNYSLAMVKAVEGGREPASAGFVAAIARALRIEPEQLTGAPYRDTLDTGGVLEGLAELRAIFAEGLHVVGVEPPSLHELSAEAVALDLLCRDGKSRDALARLHVLLRQLHGALRDSSEEYRSQVFDVLAMAYIVAERLCQRLGFLTMATPALDRLEWAASQADDPIYLSQAKVRRGRILAYYGSTDAGLLYVSEGLELLNGRDDHAASVARGHGHLCGAMVASRARLYDTAMDHIAEARRAARNLTAESNLYGTRFGPVSVEINSCSVELDAGDPFKAARDGSALRLPDDLAPARAGYHWHDTARAWLLAGSPEKALKALNVARRVAPQQTRLHPSVRETLYGIASAEHRKSDSLANFAGWVGMAV